jgi:FSR family fosmidomycin resistance protein-like MFS transporter
MSIFSVGGNIGFALGPLLATPAMLYFGLKGSAVLAIPTLIMFIIVIKSSSKIHSLSAMPEEGEKNIQGAYKNEWKKFLWLSLAIISRSVVFHGINTFLPLYWVNVLHQPKAAGGMALSFFFFCGVAATITGGHLSDKIGVNNVLKIGWLITIPSVFLLTAITNHIGAWLILVPLALGLQSIATPLVLLGQKYLPANIGFASGITMGLGVSIGGLAVPFLGNYADINGLTAALRILCILPFIGALVALTIKPPKHT